MRFTVIVSSAKHQTVFQAYQGPLRAEAVRVTHFCLRAITAAHGEAVVKLSYDSARTPHTDTFICADGKVDGQPLPERWREGIE